MRTLGVDLASAAEKTAWCLLEWRRDGAAVRDLQLGADDARLLSAAQEADHVGVDAPCGWPRAFVEMLLAPPRAMRWPEERDALRYRRSDHFVKEVTGLWPLSVSSDLIGVVAMRARGLLASLQEAGKTCLEVYPAAALHQWGVPARGYKGAKNRAVLGERVDAVRAATPWLQMDAQVEALLRETDDAFDALLASLAVRAHHAGHVLAEHACPDVEAAREGWIVLPAPGSLPRLASDVP
ncbi:MAG: DUF429 domain-containing protein [Planctomycetota bacterium]